MNNLLKSKYTTNQRRVLTAFVLTAILSVGSGLTLIKSASADSTNLSLERTNQFLISSLPANLPESVKNAVLQAASERLQIPVSQLTIIKAQKQTWRDGCLELPNVDEFCTQALVPGWQVVVGERKQSLVYHTNQTGSAIRLNEKASDSTLRPVSIPASELPPPLDQGVVFREISSGGITGRTYETVLLNDGRLIRVRIGDANDSERSVRRVSVRLVQQFERLLEKKKFAEFKNLSYPAPNGSADFITYTLTSQEGTVQYNDISQNQLPKKLQSVIAAWNRIAASAENL
ncbi:hypothetical protein WKK05_10755 [Nostoc sp. UHCC 0302]|uniref:hypothetical protein n=1 Tax=Nostoc sp. UHCC 0302 TaxID=3134896 RepID=UPI00311CDAA0